MARYQKMYVAFISKYAARVCEGADLQREAIEAVLTALGVELAISFQPLFEDAINECKTKSGESARAGESQSRARSRKPENRGAQKSSADGSGSSEPSKRSGAREPSKRSGRRRGRRNYSLGSTPELKLSKEKRRSINADALALIAKEKKNYSEAELDLLRQYTGKGGLHTASKAGEREIDVGILNQHYTSYRVIRFMWSILESLGAERGWFLEAGCGIGNFAGLKPDGANMLMFDYDRTAVHIAQTLYPEEDALGVATDGVLNGQLIFCEAVNTMTGVNWHHAIRDRLVKLGIPREMIVVVNGKENNHPDKKKAIQDQFNGGEIRIIIGNTASIGEGMDLNRYTSDMHHLDVPWKPSELTQRNGRGHRQGNTNGEVTAHFYLLRFSMDAYRMGMIAKKQRWIDELWKANLDEMESGSDSDTGINAEEILFALVEDPVKRKMYQLTGALRKQAKEIEFAKQDVEPNSAQAKALNNAVRKLFSSQQSFRAVEKLPALPNGKWSNWREDGYLTTAGRIYSVYDGSMRYFAREMSTAHELFVDGHTVFSGGVIQTSDLKYAAELNMIGRSYARAGIDNERDAEQRITEVVIRYVRSYSQQRERIIGKYDSVKAAHTLTVAQDDELRGQVYLSVIASQETVVSIRELEADTGADAGLADEFASLINDLRSTDQMRSWLTENAQRLGLPWGEAARTNPARDTLEVDELVMIGNVRSLDVAGRSIPTSGYFMLTDTDRNKLLLVPRERVVRENPSASDVYEMWHGFPPGGRRVRLEAPADKQMIPVGFAENIRYTSDKIIEAGDGRGHSHNYTHDFDAGKRVAYSWGDVIVIDNLKINERGILN